MKTLTHIDKRQRPAMVDVSDKEVSRRTARASGFIALRPATIRLIRSNRMAKGNVLVTAELAGIGAAKQTWSLIPLCHILPLSSVRTKAVLKRNGVEVVSEIKCVDRTGVEMEALTAVSVALLTIYDMCKAVDRKMTITGIRLVEKRKEPVQ